MQENKEAVDMSKNHYMEGITSQNINMMIRTMMVTMTTMSVMLMLGVVQLPRGVSEDMEGKM
jgi:hypothetical protein